MPDDTDMTGQESDDLMTEGDPVEVDSGLAGPDTADQIALDAAELDAAAQAILDQQRADAEVFQATYGDTVESIRSTFAVYGGTVGSTYFGWDASAKQVPKIEVTADVALWAWVAVQIFTFKPSASQRLLPKVPEVLEPLRRVAVLTQMVLPPPLAPGLNPVAAPARPELYQPLVRTGATATYTLTGETELNAVAAIGEAFAEHRSVLAGLQGPA